jgi:dTDP-4-amino-4,6-dideoxygalactose transaminase
MVALHTTRDLPFQEVPFVDLRAQFHSIEREIRDAIESVLAGMDLNGQSNVRAFEAEFAAYCRVRYAVAVSSGTDALALALRACGVSPGDEVVTVSHAPFSTIEAIVQLGAFPVYVDVDPTSYTIDPAEIDAAVGPRTRVIVPVHLHGQMADMSAVNERAKRHGLVVIEDARQAHGAEDRGHRAGSAGDAAAFSFAVERNLGAYGDAGAVTTDSRAVAEQVRLLREHGSNEPDLHCEVGVWSRMDELQAAVLRVKLRYVDVWNQLRIDCARRYDELLADLPLVRPHTRKAARHVYHRYVIQASGRDHLSAALENRGVGARVHYRVPAHRQPAVASLGRSVGALEVTEALTHQVLSLPLYPELSEEQQAYVAACVRDHAS